MTEIKFYLDIIIGLISAIGILVILWGVITALVKVIQQNIPEARQILGNYLILCLEFFIAADIIRTVTYPNWQDVGILASIVAIRTVLSYFLSLELRHKD